MIVFAIKSCFFSRANSYNFGQKSYTYHFFISFCKEMIIVVCAILVVVIKDLKICLSNSNLLTGKKVIYFETLTPKRETDK